MDEDDDELTILVGAADGSSALERDGMLRRLEESVTLAIAEIATEGYLTNGAAGEDGISLTIAAPSLASSEILSLVGDSIAALINDPDTPGWGPFSINVTDESGSDDEDDFGDFVELDGLEDLEELDDGGSEPESDDDGDLEIEADLTLPAATDPEELRKQLLRNAEQVSAGIELGWLTALDVNSENPDERAQALVEAEYVAGALFQASVLVMDHLFIDLDTLTQERDGETVADAPDDVFFVLDGLPSRYAHRYDALFTQQLIVAMADVTRRFTGGWEPVACVAQELALRLILDGTEVQLDLADIELDHGWRSAVEDALFEDPDHEMLFDAGSDGVEDDAAFLTNLGAAPMAFSDWFRPFNPTRHLPPYLLDHLGADDLSTTVLDTDDLDLEDLDLGNLEDHGTDDETPDDETQPDR
jgi:hypothetical protein